MGFGDAGYIPGLPGVAFGFLQVPAGVTRVVYDLPGARRAGQPADPHRDRQPLERGDPHDAAVTVDGRAYIALAVPHGVTVTRLLLLDKGGPSLAPIPPAGG
jgi:hypothetical protein